MASDPGGNAIAMQLLLLVLLTLVNAFFAGAEMAIVSVNKNKIKMLAEKGNKKARLIEMCIRDSNWSTQKDFVSTALVGVRSVRHVAENLNTFTWQLSAAEMQKIDAEITRLGLDQL